MHLFVRHLVLGNENKIAWLYSSPARLVNEGATFSGSLLRVCLSACPVLSFGASMS